ncbi:MAG: SMC family ATPase [Candidatus Altiarchaeota archaeon]|nr:SMC family ATPase [Candidatus Altiarchaeota archaeon]
MRLLTLELENWSCHSSLSLDLSSGLQIEGRNGSGKSSILEAIRFVFAETARKYTGRLKNGERSARVSLSFEKDGSTYVVEKELLLDKASTARMLCNGVVVGDNPSSVYARMQNILDENVIDKLLYIPQGGLTSIVEGLTRDEGKRKLDSLFGLERFDRVYKESAEDVKEAKLKLEFSAEQLARHPKDADREYSEELGKISGEQKTIEAEAKALSAEVAGLDGEISKADAGVKKLEESKRKLDALKEELKTLDVSSAKSAAELEAVRQRLERMSKAASDLASLSEKAVELKKYAEMRELLQKLERLDEKHSSMMLDRDRERLMALSGVLAEKAELEKTAAEAENALKQDEASKAASEHELKGMESRLKDLEGLNGQAACPRCGQALTPEHLEAEKAATLESAGKLKETLAGLLESVNAGQASLKKLKKEYSSLEKNDAEYRYLKAELERKTDEEKDLLEAVSFVKNKLSAAGYGDEGARFVEEKVAEYGKVCGEIELLTEEVKQKAGLEARRKTLSDSLSSTASRRENISAAVGQIAFKDDDLAILRKLKDELVAKRYALFSECDRKQYRIMELNIRHEESEKKLNEYRRFREGRDSQERELRVLSQAREVFHTDKGIQKYLRDRYISQLNGLLTYYFKRLNENPKYNEIAFDKDYELQVRTTDGVMAIEQLSGGEKIQLAIALRIALTEMLSHTRILILDEPFGSLDRNHREILGETLNKIAAGGQLIVVTHIHVDSLQLSRVELGGY